jgi:hypothetical protein
MITSGQSIENPVAGVCIVFCKTARDTKGA